MARLKKAHLLSRVEHGFREGGWDLLYISDRNQHPVRYRVYRNDVAMTVCIYIWNITHGGGRARPENEYRIQITGVNNDAFLSHPGAKTLILGWWENEEVFAGFDCRVHSSKLGSSPSFQVGQEALRDAVANRLGAHHKSTGELVITFQPEFLGTYAENLEALHDTGTEVTEVDVIKRISIVTERVTEADISNSVISPRRYAVAQTRRAVRALDFRARVLSAYEQRCAMCGVQLKLVDGAHILPVHEYGSTDATSNGIALCVLHHRAYDRGLITFDANYLVRISEHRLDELRAANLDGGLEKFRESLRNVIKVPAELSSRPDPSFVGTANKLRGWNH